MGDGPGKGKGPAGPIENMNIRGGVINLRIWWAE